MKILKGTTKVKKTRIMVVSCIIIICSFFISEIVAYSTTPRVIGSPVVTSDDPWIMGEDEMFLMGVSLNPNSSIPVVFDSAAVYDTVTEQSLGLDCFLYDEGREGNDKMMGAHCGPMEEIEEYFGEKYMLPVSGTKTNSQQMVVGFFWQEFPPWDHPIDIQVSYRVLGIVPKTDNVVYHWDTQEQEMENPSKSLLDWTKEGLYWLWNA